jgi:membrane protein CcdC involved in cytochrome C biogenesis
MIKPIHLLIGIASFIVAHILTFYQLNGQFLKSTDWFRKNILIVAAAGIILSFFYIWGTKYAVSGMGGLLWPARFIGFGVGMIIYAIFVQYHFNEGINAKTLVSLSLAFILICIQVLWKVK